MAVVVLVLILVPSIILMIVIKAVVEVVLIWTYSEFEYSTQLLLFIG